MKKREESTLAAAGFALGIGISFAVIIGMGIFIGRWIDAVSYTHLDVYKRQIMKWKSIRKADIRKLQSAC